MILYFLEGGGGAMVKRLAMRTLDLLGRRLSTTYSFHEPRLLSRPSATRTANHPEKGIPKTIVAVNERRYRLV